MEPLGKHLRAVDHVSLLPASWANQLLKALPPTFLPGGINLVPVWASHGFLGGDPAARKITRFFEVFAGES